MLAAARQQFAAGHWQNLLTTCRNILSVNPENTEIKYLLSLALLQQNKIDDAIAILDEILKADENNVDVLNTLAIANEKLGYFSKALDYYQKAVKLMPHSVALAVNMAELLRTTKQARQAVQVLSEALDFNPDDSRLLDQLAISYTVLGENAKAEHSWLRAIAIEPNNAQVLNNLSAYYYQEHQYAKAIQLATRAWQLAPDKANILNNLGNCLNALNRFEEAIPVLQDATRLHPKLVPAWRNLGHAYHNTGQFDRALICFEKALQLDPHNKYSIWQRAFTRLMTGDFKRGWEDYETGLEIKTRLNKTGSRNPWQPGIEKNENVLMCVEQGVGDQIMFVSCLPELIQECNKVYLECDPRLAPLFQRAFPDVVVLPLSDPRKTWTTKELPEVNYQVSMGSLPRYFRQNLASFPRRSAFLQPPPKSLLKWQQRYAQLGEGLKVGISWEAGVRVEHAKRSLTLGQLLPILRNKDCQFINLQYGDVAVELRTFEENYNISIHEWPDSDSKKELDDFSAKISALDLVISVGNANVHLAGALGVPAWCLVPHVPSWRWMYQGNQSVWYPSVRLYRQPALNQWSPVIQQVAKDLSDLL